MFSPLIWRVLLHNRPRLSFAGQHSIWHNLFFIIKHILVCYCSNLVKGRKYNLLFILLTKIFILSERPPSELPLDWPTRKRIALGSARGLSYLHDHCDPKIIHRDVKAANILLDEEFEAVVGDFGLAKLMDYKDTHVTTAVRGTIGHIAPEYLSTGKSSEKTDVFGYGIMLLELITGQRAFDLARLANDDDVMLLDWVRCHTCFT